MARGALTPELEADTALEPLGDGRWGGVVSERWWIERGPYGGYVAAFMTRALIEAVADPGRAPRSLTVLWSRDGVLLAQSRQLAVMRA